MSICRCENNANIHYSVRNTRRNPCSVIKHSRFAGDMNHSPGYMVPCFLSLQGHVRRTPLCVRLSLIKTILLPISAQSTSIAAAYRSPSSIGSSLSLSASLFPSSSSFPFSKYYLIPIPWKRGEAINGTSAANVTSVCKMYRAKLCTCAHRVIDSLLRR